MSVSLVDIMREQANEKATKKYEAQFYDYELELVKKLSLEEAKNTPVTAEKPETLDPVSQLEQDEMLALYLQREERSKVKRVQQPSALKRLTPLEYKLLNEQFGVEPEPEDEPEETEYNYVEPFEIDPQENPKPEYPLLYDDAQKKEDKEIGHVEKRMAEKRVNAAPVAMHHKTYATRNKGKVLVYGSNRVRPTPKSYTFPVKSDEYDYGHVTKVLGGCRYLVFCYSTGRTKLCRMTGKLKYSKTPVFKGEVVLFRVRSYQDKKADIVYKYSEEEYHTLLDIGELIERDPKKMLPDEVWKKILSYLDPDSLSNLQTIYGKL